MLEITRELVEHYLRATGWTCLGGNPVVYRSANAEYDIVLSSDSIPRSIQYIASASKTPRHLVAFRLGLCAAAESLFENAQEEDDNPFGNAAAVRAIIDRYRRSGTKILALARIDPLAWESARKR